jgi:hypothetical protein
MRPSGLSCDRRVSIDFSGLRIGVRGPLAFQDLRGGFISSSLADSVISDRPHIHDALHAPHCQTLGMLGLWKPCCAHGDPNRVWHGDGNHPLTRTPHGDPHGFDAVPLTALPPVTLTVGALSMDHEDDKDWCSINEAARRLKVTPTAIRNRIKRGTLKTKPNGNHGRLVHVPPLVALAVIPPVPLIGSDTVTPTAADAVTLTVTPTVPDPLVPELRTQISTLETRLRAIQEELLLMAQKAGASEAEINALQAQAIEIRADRDAWRTQAERLAVSVERRPWWRRLAG